MSKGPKGSGPQDGRIPSARRAAFARVADATRVGFVVVVCRARDIRRQYRREVTKRGGNAGNLVFVIDANVPDDMADRVRRRGGFGAGVEVLDVREFGPVGGQG